MKTGKLLIVLNFEFDSKKLNSIEIQVHETKIQKLFEIEILSKHQKHY